MNIGEQISRQSLALVSLLVALGALGYNTWRNERTEHNRNIRQAGFEMLVHIGELQRITYVAQYDAGRQEVSPLAGSVEALVLRDLAHLMPVASRVPAEKLYQAWSDNWVDLGKDEYAAAVIDRAISDLRTDVVAVLDALD